MGSWGAGNFQNDNALYWVGNLVESGAVDTVRAALLVATAPPPPSRPSFIARVLFGARPIPYQLSAQQAYEALAAAEIVACWLAQPSTQLPEELAKWARERSNFCTPEFIALARQAVGVIKSNSELKDFAEEGNTPIADEWRSVVADLERRLQN